jgi:hypothetical protein
MLVNPVAFRDSKSWAKFVCTALSEARLLEQSFTLDEHSTANLVAPRGNIIISAVDPPQLPNTSFPPFARTSCILQLVKAATTPKGVRFVAAGIWKLENGLAFFCLLSSAPISTKPKFLTHSGYGNI